MARQLKLSYIIEATEQGGQVLDGIGRRLDAVGRSYAGLAAMIGGGIELKASIDEDSYFHQLAALTNTSLATVQKIKSHIHEVAEASKVNSDEMIHAMAAFKAGGGTFEEFDDSVQGTANAIGVLGGKGEQVGRILAALDRSFEIKGPKNLTADLAMLTKQIGSVNGDIEAFAQVFPDLAVKYAAEGHTGEQGARELGAVFATLQQTSRSPRAAYGAVESVIEIMQTQESRERFTGATAIKTEDRPGHARSLIDVIRDISIASHDPGRAWNLNHALDAQAIAAMQNFSSPAGQATLARLMAIQGDSKELERQRELATSGIGGTATKVQEEFKDIGDKVVGVLDKFAPVLDKVAAPLAIVGAGLAGLSVASHVVAGVRILTSSIGLLGISAGKAAASIDKEAAADATRRGGVGGGKAALIGKSMIYGWAADEGLTALDPNDAFGDWMDNNIPGASWLDNFASHLGLGRDYAEQRRVAKALHPDRDRPAPPLDAARYLPRGMHIPGAGGAGGAIDAGHAREVAQYLMEHGHLTEAQARGVAAGAWAESRLDPNAVNPASGAYGIGQWLGARKRELFRRYGAHPSMPQQLDFLNWELHGGDAGGAVRAAQSEGGALDAYVRRFMRPAPGVETLQDLERGRAMLSRIGGEIVVRIEAAEGTRARVTSIKSSNPDVALTASMGVGMVAP